MPVQNRTRGPSQQPPAESEAPKKLKAAKKPKRPWSKKTAKLPDGV